MFWLYLVSYVLVLKIYSHILCLVRTRFAGANSLFSWFLPDIFDIYFWFIKMVSSLGRLLSHFLISILVFHWCHCHLSLSHLWLWCCHLSIVSYLLLSISFCWVCILGVNSICEVHRLSGVFLLGLQFVFVCLAKFP